MQANKKWLCHFRIVLTGEMAEWSIVAVSKTVVPSGTGGSNPPLSAIKGVNQTIVRFMPFFTSKNQLRGVVFPFHAFFLRKSQNILELYITSDFKAMLHIILLSSHHHTIDNEYYLSFVIYMSIIWMSRYLQE